MASAQWAHAPLTAVDVDALRCGPLTDREVDQVVCTLNAAGRGSSLQLALDVGKTVIDELFDGDLDAWRTRGVHDISFRRLAARGDLFLDAEWLCRSANIYEMTQRLGIVDLRQLSLSHLQAMLQMCNGDVEPELLAEAEVARWTVAMLRAKVRALMTPPGRRRAPPPAFVGSVLLLGMVFDNPDSFRGLEDAPHLDPALIREVYDKITHMRELCERLQQSLSPALSDHS
jgi:hypothetical protein